jgi:phosphoribosylformimino-5-aminoimidazole carboxamide ribotide isomerase
LNVDLYCAIDLLDGRAVRLLRGDFGKRREFGDPLELVSSYASGGARWLHVVDLDAARTGTPKNRALVGEVVGEARRRDLWVQAGGGVRSFEDAAAMFDLGVSRVVVGTAAQRDPEMVRQLTEVFPGRVAVGLDHKGESADVAIEGWVEGSGIAVGEALGRLDGLDLAAVVVTSIERDGTLSGPDLEGLEGILGGTLHEVIASGGVRSVSDLSALAALKSQGRSLSGAIVGTALLDGTLGVKEAVSACEASE